MRISDNMITDINAKLKILDEIYAIYDRYHTSLSLSCTRGCATCCTRNVTLTTLEGHNILNSLSKNQEEKILKAVFQNRRGKRFLPEITLNGMAQCLIEGKEIPSEDYPLKDNCPLLDHDLCTIYPVRPFGCRCFISKRNCAETGAADVDPFVVTVNNVFIQFIEHVDADGYTGNLTDTLLFQLDKANKAPSPDPKAYALVKNQPIPMLLIPPEHREKITGILSQLNGIKVPAG